MENQMKEISRRMFMDADDGIACGPCGVCGVDAEIVVEDNGKTVYLHGQWNSETNDYLLEATVRSVYDLYEQMHQTDDLDKIEELVYLCDEIAELSARDPLLATIDDRERYAEQYSAILDMLADGIRQMDLEFEDDE